MGMLKNADLMGSPPSRGDRTARHVRDRASGFLTAAGHAVADALALVESSPGLLTARDLDTLRALSAALGVAATNVHDGRDGLLYDVFGAPVLLVPHQGRNWP